MPVPAPKEGEMDFTLQQIAEMQEHMKKDPNFAKMAKEYFKKTGDLLGARPAYEQQKKLKAAEGKK